jgi:hypothetical protein
MKRSELNQFIKENIIETLTESPSSEEVKMARQAVARFMKYRNVSQEEAVRDLINALKEIQPKEDDQRYIDYLRRSGRDKEADKLSKNNPALKEELPSKEEVEDTTAAVQALKKELEDLKEDDDIDDKDAIAQAKAARGKHKKLDIAVEALKDIKTKMQSLARKYSSADEVEKEKIKDDLKAKTAKKKELESLVAKLEKDVV